MLKIVEILVLLIGAYYNIVKYCIKAAAILTVFEVIYKGVNGNEVIELESIEGHVDSKK